MEDYIHMIIAIILFLAAMAVCVSGERKIYDTVEQRQAGYNDVILFEKPKHKEDFCITGDKVLAKLFFPADIEIQLCYGDNSIETIKKGMIGSEVLRNIGSVRNGVYRVEYEYDDAGKCVLLRFIEQEVKGISWRTLDVMLQS